MDRKVKVCHMTSIHPRYDARILLKQCTSLVKLGYDVTLIVNDNKHDEEFNGVKILSTGFLPANRLDRFRHSSKEVLKKAMEVDADIYQFHDPDLMKVGIKLKRMGKKVIFDMHEDVPIDIAYKEWIPSSLRKSVSKIAFLYEKKYIDKYDAVVTVTPHVVDRVKKLNPNTFLITNFPLLRERDIPSRKKNEIFNICFAGAIVRQWQHKEIIEAISDLDNVKYLLAGSYDENYMNELKALKGWRNVEFYGMVSRDKVEEIYAESNIGMALLMYSETTGNKIGTLGNTKLFEYMENGMPIICSASDLWKAIVEKYECGLAVEPYDVNAIKNAIVYIMDHYDEGIMMGKQGQEAVKCEYSWESQERTLKKVYETLSK